MAAVCFFVSYQAHGQVVKQVIPDSPVHIPVHAYPSPQIHVQPSAPGKIPFLSMAKKKVSSSHLGQADFPAAKVRFHSKEKGLSKKSTNARAS